jgi:hypothetical protein
MDKDRRSVFSLVVLPFAGWTSLGSSCSEGVSFVVAQLDYRLCLLDLILGYVVDSSACLFGTIVDVKVGRLWSQHRIMSSSNTVEMTATIDNIRRE